MGTISLSDWMMSSRGRFIADISIGQELSHEVNMMWPWAALTIGLCILLFLFVQWRRYCEAFQQILDGVARLAKGDFTQRIIVDRPFYIVHLAYHLNDMASQLNSRVNTLVQQRNEFEVLLSSMAEGVIAFDLNEKLINLNDAAAMLLNTEPATAIGCSMQDITRDATLQRVVGKILIQNETTEDELVFTRPRINSVGRAFEQRYLQAIGSVLRDSTGKKIGGLIVFHDQTHMRKLERMRQDFVANVSHELKTPISTIKISVETLQDILENEPQVTGIATGSLDFLKIIVRQADRLHAIVEDLLTLARIEQTQECKNQIKVKPEHILTVIEHAVETCHAKLQTKDVNIDIQCPPMLHADINASLIEQALVNLLDNAIKYSPVQSSVIVDAKVQAGELIFSVIDSGLGIAADHLPRLFERFYRTDTARSRHLGGTGLGLSIVKHVAQAHQGEASVTSAIDQGSIFKITLPVPIAFKPHFE